MESKFKPTRKHSEGEIAAAETAILSHQEGAYIHGVMKEAFERERDKLPEEEEEKDDVQT